MSLDAHMVQRINVSDALRRSASVHAGKIALVDRGEEVSFRDLEDQVNRLAHEFGARRTGNGHVVIISRNSIDVARVYLACARIGMVNVLLHPALTPGEISHVLAETGARAAAVEPGLLANLMKADTAGQIEQVYLLKDVSDGDADQGSAANRVAIADLIDRPPVAAVEVVVPERDPVQCLFTSGSTARPKGVLMSHVAVTMTCFSVAMHMQASQSDVGLLNLPMNHVGGLNDSLLTFLMVGAKGVIMSEWNPALAAELIERHGITIGMMSGPMWSGILDAADRDGRDLSSLRRCNVGMANLKPSERDRLRERCPQAAVLMVSGQTEFNGYQEGVRVADQFSKDGAWGSPTLANEIEIMGEDGGFLPPGAVGEIVYRGPQAMSGYLNAPVETEQAFARGWFHTGDLGYVDEDHVVWFVDRKKSMVKTGGENVSPQEVSDILLDHDDVLECAVFGVPHDRWTEAVTAVVKLREGAHVDEAGLQRHCRQRLAAFKVPKAVIFVDELPRNSTGKIRGQELQDRYRDHFIATITP